MGVVPWTKWSHGHDILPRSHELISCGQDKTSLSDPNMSPPGRSKFFSDFSEFLLHLEAVFFKTGYLQSFLFFDKFQMFIIQVLKSLIQNYVKCHIIFSFVKWHLSIISIYTIQIQIVRLLISPANSLKEC